MNHLLAREKRHDKADQGHTKDSVSRREHPSLHPDWRIAFGHGEPNYTHAGCEEQDSQHWRKVHSDRCLSERLTDGPMRCIFALEVSNHAEDSKCCVDKQVLNGEVHHALHRCRDGVLALGPEYSDLVRRGADRACCATNSISCTCRHGSRTFTYFVSADRVTGRIHTALNCTSSIAYAFHCICHWVVLSTKRVLLGDH